MTRSEELPPPLPDSVLDRNAWDQAVAGNSNAALIFFLARNPDSPYASAARQMLASRRAPDPPGTARAVAGPDAGIIEAFDAARLSGDSGALDGFIASYGNYPLAAEALRLKSR